jgi:predicted dienelactone hydrolase
VFRRCQFVLTMFLLPVLLSAAPPQRGAIRRPIQERRAEHTVKIGGLDVAVWKPAASAAGRAPLILFSHGLHGCNTQSTFLMNAVAAAGYLVIAPNHKDAICGRGARAFLSVKPEESLREPASWTDKTYRDRHDDMTRLAEALRRDSEWNGQIDWSLVGLVGHSLGGYTVLGLAGAWPSWTLPNVKAVLALSPYCEPYVVNGNLGGIKIQVMYQGGTRDLGITPSVKRSGGCFAKTSSPAIFVEFQGAGHFSWSDLQPTAHDLIVEYSLAFLDKYVRGVSGADPAAKKPGVTELKVR